MDDHFVEEESPKEVHCQTQFEWSSRKWAIVHHDANPEPDARIAIHIRPSLDDFYLARPGAHEAQLDLFLDYAKNVELYPEFQNFFRKHKPPFLAVWGKNDPFFLPAGAEAFKRDIPEAEVRFFDTGHFALETHCAEIGSAILEFLKKSLG